MLPEVKKLGGTLANYAWHIQLLGTEALVVSAVGQDKDGAGGSFTSVLTMRMLEGLSLTEIHRLSLVISAFVCKQKGATSVVPQANYENQKMERMNIASLHFFQSLFNIGLSFSYFE